MRRLQRSLIKSVYARTQDQARLHLMSSDINLSVNNFNLDGSIRFTKHIKLL